MPRSTSSLNKTTRSLGIRSRPPSFCCDHRVMGKRRKYNAKQRNGPATIHPNKAWAMANSRSPDAFPVMACQSASFVSGKGEAPTRLSPTRRKGIIKRNSKGVAMRLARISVGPLHLEPRIVIVTPQRSTVRP